MFTFRGKAGRLAENMKRAWGYCRRNGPAAAGAAIAERLLEQREDYVYCPPGEEERSRQRLAAGEWENPPLFSVAVPAYETEEPFLKDLLDCMQDQTWPFWELIIADGSGSNRIARAVEERREKRIRYVKLAENRGIAENTNEAVRLARGEYIGLLDHDDLLTPDALYRMAHALREKRRQGIDPVFLYSDEDKCDRDKKNFFAPHRKPDFNLDLLLSNNYICHFLMMEAGLLGELMLRPGYDGAQDYDLVLRAAGKALDEGREDVCVHVYGVLYHWRCHSASTASNPGSKNYAYEAGKRALEDFAASRGWKVKVSHTRHLGFYRTEFGPELFKQREDVGALAWPLPSRGGKLVSGIYDRRDGGVRMRYAGLWKGFSGRFHRAALAQDVEAADIRSMQVRPEWEEAFQKALSDLRSGGEPAEISLEFCAKIRERGQRILWDPCRRDGYVEDHRDNPEL